MQENLLDKEKFMDRTKLMMLALMNDCLAHHKDAIIHTVYELNIHNMEEAEFNELLQKTNGHGGKMTDGKCSVCLEFLQNKQLTFSIPTTCVECGRKGIEIPDQPTSIVHKTILCSDCKRNEGEKSGRIL